MGTCCRVEERDASSRKTATATLSRHARAVWDPSALVPSPSPKLRPHEPTRTTAAPHRATGDIPSAGSFVMTVVLRCSRSASASPGSRRGSMNVADSAPNINQLKPRDPGQLSEVFASDGSLLGYITSGRPAHVRVRQDDPADPQARRRWRSRTAASTSTAASTTRASSAPRSRTCSAAASRSRAARR